MNAAGCNDGVAASPLAVRLHRQLSPAAWPGKGLSPANRVICALILVSVTLVMLETEPVLFERAATFFIAAEAILGGLFLIEYVARVYAAGAEPRFAGVRGRLRYMATPVALLDLVAIGPLFMLGTTDTLLLRLFRLLRLLRLARLGRLSKAMRALETAVIARRYELGWSLTLAIIVLIAAATAMYLVEGGVQPDAFGSIPRALWWSVATLTTVGYGDVYPVTPLGRVVAAVTAIVAIGLVAMPAGILAAAFSDTFQRQTRDRDDDTDDGDGETRATLTAGGGRVGSAPRPPV